MKHCYVYKCFSMPLLKIIDQANEIIEEYQQMGFTLTLRQLYYQFVSRDLLANKQSEYKRLGSVINDARLAGLVDWSAMEDRTRNLVAPSTWDSPSAIIRACARQFQSDWWEDQPFYVEVWIEKDALLGVLEHACEPWQLPYFSCRGYTSASEVWVAAQRIGQKIDAGKEVIVLHLGDHDPSGCDMTRDVEARLRLFLEGDERDWRSHHQFCVRRVALNMDQVRQYNPPPNPAKLTDSRAANYIALYGDESWELDALSPDTLSRLIEHHVTGLLDAEKWNKQSHLQQVARAQLQLAANRWDDIIEFVGG
jgi:hypothetical protein